MAYRGKSTEFSPPDIDDGGLRTVEAKEHELAMIEPHVPAARPRRAA